jgi:putative Ca2+/H+ antiporter (TMEM165/GDT1 family)
VVVGVAVKVGGSGVLVGVAVGMLVCVGVAVGSGKEIPHAEEIRSKIIVRFVSKSFFIWRSLIESLMIAITALDKGE